MNGCINVAEAPEFMVSRRLPNTVETAQSASIPEPNSPLENTPHNTCNGDLSITCGNRHCPRCQANARDRWIEARSRELLPTPYVHVVFTLPHELAPLALQNKRVIYDLLFHASAETLLQVARDPKCLGAISASSACCILGTRISLR